MVFTILFASHKRLSASAFVNLFQVRQFPLHCFSKAASMLSFLLQESRAVQQCAINSLQISLCWSRSSLTAEQESQSKQLLVKIK